jgi:hypothetical protein
MVAKHTTCVTVSHDLLFVYWFYLTDFFLACRIVWSNFEIADMDFWRGKIYSEFFEYLDRTGGFYYEVCLRTDL